MKSKEYLEKNLPLQLATADLGERAKLTHARWCYQVRKKTETKVINTEKTKEGNAEAEPQ